MGGRGSASGIGGGIPESNVSTFKGAHGQDPFFGEVAKTTNKYMMFDQVRDKDNAIIMTNNIKIIKGNPVLVTGDHTAIYLKNGQYRLMVDNKNGVEAFAVKVNRNNFKEYTFRGAFDNAPAKKDTFDSLWKKAVSQQKRKQKWKSGGRIWIDNWSWSKD